MQEKKDLFLEQNELERLTILKNYGVLDNLPQEEFDNIVYLAQQICQTPIALISFIDKDKQWIKAQKGLEIDLIPRNNSFCNYTILEETLQIPNTILDPRFTDNIFVKKEPAIKFYAGASLVTPNKYKIGTLCVMDFVPRQLTPEQLLSLSKLSQQVITLLESYQQTKILKANENRTKALIDNMLLGLIITNTQGIIETVNPVAENIFQYKEKELIGKNLASLLPELKDPARTLLIRNFSQSRKHPIHWKGLSKNGDRLSLELSSYEFSTPEGQHIANNIKEVSDSEKLEKLKTGFISTINHELRTPLTSINGALNLLSCGILGNLPEEAQEVVELAERNCVRLISLLNDILDLQRLEASHSEMNFQVHCLSNLIDQAIEEIIVPASKKNIFVTTKSTQTRVFADRKCLTQAIGNFLKNAINFSPENSTIKIEQEREQEWVTVKIIDQGCGIPETHLETIFDKFQQVDFTDNRQQSGFGIGLAICKAIIEQHNGTLGVESVLNQGSLFWFRIPCIFEEYLPLASTESSLLITPISDNVSIPKNTLPSPKILLIDDDIELLEILAIDLSQRGLVVTTSTNGQEAVQIAQTNLPNLIVLDVNIPNGNGFEVVEKLRSEPTLQNVSLIVYSGRDLTGEQKTKLCLGPTRFLTKTRVSCADFRNNILELLNHQAV